LVLLGNHPEATKRLAFWNRGSEVERFARTDRGRHGLIKQRFHGVDADSVEHVGHIARGRANMATDEFIGFKQITERGGHKWLLGTRRIVVAAPAVICA
jgi:hypothetical protein